MKWLKRSIVGVCLLYAVRGPAYDERVSDGADSIRRPSVALRPDSLGGHVFLKAREVGEELFLVGVEGVAIRWHGDHDRPQQLTIPVDVTLTSICFTDVMRGWIGGSHGTMLATNDGGASWKLVNTGLTDDGPILDILCTNTGLVVGLSVFGQLTISYDGGDTWRTAALHAISVDGDEVDPHLLSIQRLNNGRLLIVGELGASFTSDDDGKSWEEIQELIGATLFGQLQSANGQIYVYGMEGRIWESGPTATTWSLIDTGVKQSLFAATERDGVVRFYGEEGVWIELESSAGSRLPRAGFNRERASVLAAYSQIDYTLLCTKEGIYRSMVTGTTTKQQAPVEIGEKLWR